MSVARVGDGGGKEGDSQSVGSALYSCFVRSAPRAGKCMDLYQCQQMFLRDKPIDGAVKADGLLGRVTGDPFSQGCLQVIFLHIWLITAT